MQSETQELVGKKIRLIKMDDLDPVPSGTIGIIDRVIEFDGDIVIDVVWEIQRTLSIIDSIDIYEVIEDENEEDDDERSSFDNDRSRFQR